MPFVGGDLPPPARKRRWQDNDDSDRGLRALYRTEDGTSPQRCSFVGERQYMIAARKMAAPVSKRTRFGDDGHEYCDSEFTPSHRLRLSHQAQRQKTQQGIIATPTPVAIHRPSKNTLAPCHICHRRPTKKSDLDSFAQCEGCNEQTCFVCIRQCHGTGDMSAVLSEQEALSRSFHMEDADEASAADKRNLDGTSPTQQQQDHAKQNDDTPKNWAARGHRSVVCSRCCVEKGAEGEVVCLGCLCGDESSDSMVF